ncbi:MAG: hypothetical protein ACI395_00735 [Candidatus Cryptobacteroides sp.]
MAAYESEKEENRVLREELKTAGDRITGYKKQIEELERKIDNLGLAGAFLGGEGNNVEAKRKIDRMIREIDRCIKLMEGQ